MPVEPVLGIATVPVGDHVTAHTGLPGLLNVINLDTVWMTVAAGAIVLALGFYARSRATAGVPGKVQLVWELLVDTVSTQVESSLGPRYKRVVPLAVTLFIFILTVNWLEILPGVYHNTDYIPAASADVNLTYALGLLVIGLANAAAIKQKGLRGYVAHYFRKPVVMFPLHVIEEVVKPFTLALRLFGNLFAGGIMIALILAFTSPFSAPVTAVVTVGWKLFDMFIGLIQAFIFALLTILYYEFAVSEDAH